MTTERRNVALVAHVDHGKTTLVDALLRASGAVEDRGPAVDRILDSDDQERERGITILAKAASVTWHGTRINLVDTPGHADFGGEVERALAMVDGVVLLVDAAEGPLPQTRYVLGKALAGGLPVILALNKVDRQDARTAEVLAEVEHLFLELVSDESQLSFPVLSLVAREGRAMNGVGMPAPDADLSPLFEAIVRHVPAPAANPEAPLQALVTNLDASDYLGRLAIGRVIAGTLRKGSMVSLVRREDAEPPIVRARLSDLQVFEGVERKSVEAVESGDLFVAAGLDLVEVGDTIASDTDPKALPRLDVDVPILRMTFGVSTSPLAGREGRFLTARHLRDRLEREVLGNVSIRLTPTLEPDVIEVAGRGELQLAVLIENMRREGFELQVSRPQVVTRRGSAGVEEPMEEGSCDVPDEYVGVITQALAPRKATITAIEPGDPGRTMVRFTAPSRGLIGLRRELLTDTRGTVLMHQALTGWMPWCGELPHRTGGAMVADRTGQVTAYALDNLQLRGRLFVAPGDDVYEGMVVGENAREEEMVVNAVRAKEKTNIRTHSHDDAVRLAAPIVHTIETAMEWIADDELIEVTPSAVRIRKRELGLEDRRRAAKRSA